MLKVLLEELVCLRRLHVPRAGNLSDFQADLTYERAELGCAFESTTYLHTPTLPLAQPTRNTFTPLTSSRAALLGSPAVPGSDLVVVQGTLSPKKATWSMIGFDLAADSLRISRSSALEMG